MTILDFVGAPTSDASLATTSVIRHGVAVIQLHDGLWRITRPNGEVLGYIELLDDSRGDRYRAKRLLPRQRRFLAIGEFWSIDDALDCFRF